MAYYNNHPYPSQQATSPGRQAPPATPYTPVAAHSSHSLSPSYAPSYAPSYSTAAPAHPPARSNDAYATYSDPPGMNPYGYSTHGRQKSWDAQTSSSTHHLVDMSAMKEVGVDYPPTVGYQQPPMPMPGGWGGAYGTPPPISSGGYSAARDKMMRRRSVRRVELKEGNLVLDCPVPSSIANTSIGEEGTHMRYTAATCDPDDFVRQKFTLRPYLLRRQTELFIVLTMYNEDEELFCKTMNAVIKNITHLCGRDRSKTWGHEAWKKVVVCVVSDGRKKINQRTLKVLTLMGCYQDGILKEKVAEKDTAAHIFEYTTQAIVQEDGTVLRGDVPIQVLFCLKEQNKKKLNSHRWFFNAFGPLLNPNVCVLLDVGTKPSGTSIYELWKVFDKHAGVGGACGEICVDTGRGCQNLLNPLVAAQNFEYKISNILDKPLESVFGYISVLPGAFSAYRYRALQNGPNGKGPLHSYFKGETLHAPGAKAGVFDANMYLAEDRILCFEIVTKKNEAWTLRYVKSAKAATDVPNSTAEFISQRRRWLNGSFFASLHATLFFFRIFTSGQNIIRMFILFLEFIYQAVQMLFTWTSLANFYLAFFFLTNAATKNEATDPFQGYGDTIVEVAQKVYLGLLFLVIVCSLGNRPQGSRFMYVSCIIIFGLLQLLALFCAGWTIYQALPKTASGWENIHALFSNETFRNIVISLATTFGLYILGSLVHAEIWHLFTSTIQYLFMLPSFINVLLIYSMCNLHDVSWGTKGDNSGHKEEAKKVKGEDGKTMLEVSMPSSKEDIDKLWTQARSALAHAEPELDQKRDASTKQEDDFRTFRTNTVLAFVGTNMFIIIFFTSNAFLDWAASTFTNTATNPYMIFIFWSVAGLAAFRFLGSFLYMVFRLFGH